MTRGIAILLAFLSAPALADPATVIRPVDGDTILVSMAGRRVTVRVAGIDSPETARAKCDRERQMGLAAKRAAQELLPAGAAVDVRPTGARDKYSRLVARIVLQDGRDFGSILLQLGHASPYNGRGPKRNWCQ